MAKNSLDNPQIKSNLEIMEELLASQSFKPQSFEQGEEVEGIIIAKSESEVIVDFGFKSEGTISAREIPQDKLDSLKLGDKIRVFITQLENNEGLAVLSLNRSVSKQKPGISGPKGNFWQKFTAAKSQKSTFVGKCVEINKGGLILEVDGARGFLPSSQIGFNGLNVLLSGSGPVDRDLVVNVSEVDQANNRLIFSQKTLVSEEEKAKLTSFSHKQKVKGKVSAVLPFGLVIGFEGGVGFISPQDTSWEKVEALEGTFRVGEEVDATITNVDQELGRINLSLKNLEDDPLAKFTQKVEGQEVIKGTVLEVNPNGVSVKLDEGVSGFIPSSKIDSPSDFEVGKTVSVVIDSIDSQRRRISLAPFITTTKGLIYK